MDLRSGLLVLVRLQFDGSDAHGEFVCMLQAIQSGVEAIGGIEGWQQATFELGERGSSPTTRRGMTLALAHACMGKSDATLAIVSSFSCQFPTAAAKTRQRTNRVETLHDAFRSSCSRLGSPSTVARVSRSCFPNPTTFPTHQRKGVPQHLHLRLPKPPPE
jgi:hypothetical protein